MKQQTQSIPTTHTGSLPRPTDVEQMLRAQDRGEQGESSLFEARVRDAVQAIVAQQRACGITIVNDGEMSKVSYSTYVKDRLTGFGGQSARKHTPAADLTDFPAFTQQRYRSPWATYLMPICNGPISYVGKAQLERDCANLKAAMSGVDADEAFMTAASPGVIARFLENQYYPTHEAYLFALADAMKVEYDAISQAGFILQIDCPDLTRCHELEDAQKGKDMLALHLEVLNDAVRDIPPEHMRMHLCWGNYEGPHHKDIPLHQIITAVLQARPAGLSFEAANPRHAHEWQVFEEVTLPEGKVLLPGVIDTTTNFIEHPELVAQRLVRFASLVGRERLIASTDCGFATFAGWHHVDQEIAWAKLAALVEGAHLASRQLG